MAHVNERVARLENNDNHVHDGSALRFQFVLRALFKITGVMAFVELVVGFTRDAIDHAPTLDGWSFGDRIGPTIDVSVILNLQEVDFRGDRRGISVARRNKSSA